MWARKAMNTLNARNELKVRRKEGAEAKTKGKAKAKAKAKAKDLAVKEVGAEVYEIMKPYMDKFFQAYTEATEKIAAGAIDSAATTTKETRAWETCQLMKRLRSSGLLITMVS